MSFYFSILETYIFPPEILGKFSSEGTVSDLDSTSQAISWLHSKGSQIFVFDTVPPLPDASSQGLAGLSQGMTSFILTLLVRFWEL